MSNTKALRNNYRIKKGNLNNYHYTISLLQEAIKKDLIDQDTIATIQQGIFLILKDLIKKYTGGKSSSIKVETAESIQRSILYAIDCSLDSFSCPDESLEIVQNKRMEDIYEYGIKIIEKTFTESERLYKQIENNRLYISLDAYNLTISII